MICKILNNLKNAAICMAIDRTLLTQFRKFGIIIWVSHKYDAFPL